MDRKINDRFRALFFWKHYVLMKIKNVQRKSLDAITGKEDAHHVEPHLNMILILSHVELMDA